jgi:hypothetical protein
VSGLSVVSDEGGAEQAPVVLRSITFVDRTWADQQPDTSVPLAVVNDLLLNGQPTGVRWVANYGYSVSQGSSMEATVVSFVVHPDDAHLGSVDADGGNHDWATLGGFRAYTPTDPMWETLHTYRPYDFISDTGVREQTRTLLRVYLYVEEVHVRRATTIIEEKKP